MKYWWVNQNQTYDHEVGGGYLWSPKSNANGAFNRFYENMRLVQPGDVVLSFSGTYIKAMGRIVSTGYESPKPTEFGSAGAAWSDLGWRVEVDYREIPEEERIRPKDHMDVLAPLLPDKYSPLQPNGNGLQGVYMRNFPTRSQRPCST